MYKLLDGAEPFLFPGDAAKAGARIGCLCLHGLNASPQEVYWLGQHLAEQGAMVIGPRLFGHGIDVSLLNHSRWPDWIASALDGYHLLRAHCDYIFPIGLSMGGLCALLVAAEYPVAGVVPIAAALRLRIPERQSRMAHVLRYTGMTVGKYDRATDQIDQRVKRIQQERGLPTTGRVSYYAHKATGIAELLKLQTVVRAALPKISAPALLIYSEGDSLIPYEVMGDLQREMVNAARIETMPLRESDHIIVNDVEMDQVFARVWTFIQDRVRERSV